MSRPQLTTMICEMLNIEYPVLLAGMGGVAGAELVAAVSEAGGLGILGAATMSGDEIREQVRKIRSLTDRPFGVDILLPAGVASAPRPEGQTLPQDPRELLPAEYREFVEAAKKHFGLPEAEARTDDFHGHVGSRLQALMSGEFTKKQVEAILDERVPVFASGLGNPAPFVEACHAIGTKVIALVGNVKNARRVAEGGTDIIVAQGHEAGGHTGRIGTMALVPQVVDAVAPKPVLVAGGVGDGRGLAAALALGAHGAWVGTAFVVTKEANWPQVLKERILAAREEDTRVTRLYSGKTMRNINNPLIEYWEQANIAALPMGLQGLVSGEIMAGAQRAGKLELLMNPAGQISGMFHELRPARDVVEEIVEGAARVLTRDLPSHVAVSA